MRTILLTNNYKGTPLKIVQSEAPKDFSIRFLEDQTEQCLSNSITDVDYILAGGRIKISRNVLSNANRLKMIQRSGVGLDALDLEAIKEKSIPLYVNQGINAESVAEHTLMLILSALRRLTEINSNTHNGIWKKQEQGLKTFELHGKTVGIIGMGNIAKTLIRLLKPFGVSIIYYNLFRESEEYEKENNMRFASINETLSESNIVTLHCALTNETTHLICKKSLAVMKDGAVLVNTARGQIVNTIDLADALKSGKISFACLDVHESEPLCDDYILKGINNVILTPHVAGVTNDSFRSMMRRAMRNIEKFDNGEFAEIEQYRYL